MPRNKPEDCQWSTAWGFEADVWEPTNATVTAAEQRPDHVEPGFGRALGVKVQSRVCGL